MTVWAKGAQSFPMVSAILSQRLRTYRPGPAAQLVIALSLALAFALAAIGTDRLIAQIEGDRGIAPVASSTDIQVGGIEVNTTGDTGEEARLEGWKLAQRKAWEKLGGPKMSDEQIDALVSAVVIEHEMIGPRRYIARLGVIFDRSKAGQFIGAGEGGSVVARSAPLLVIPVLYSGGVRQVFEVRGPWQKAWASYQSAASPIDYVRPTGAGGDSLILTAGQPGRRSRIWWRNVLDQFSASDVLIPVARIERQWPGGPVKGTFTARYGPDNKYLGSFSMTAKDENAVPDMLSKAIVRIDGIYRDALAQGLLRPDPTLLEEQRAFDAALDALKAALLPRPEEAAGPIQGPVAGSQPGAVPSQATVGTYTVQFVTPDAAAVDSALSSVRSVPGVQGAATTSIAIGGTSVMRVTASGNLEALAAALRSRGWQVTIGDNALRISR